jgi:hypothetical protein
VDFVDRFNAEKALESVRGLILHEKKLHVGWGMRNKKLFVYGLAKSANWEDEVLDLFRQHGDIEVDQCRFLASDKKCNGGVVAFCSREAAESARDALNGKWFQQHQLSVNWEQANIDIVSNEVDRTYAQVSAGVNALQGGLKYTEHPHFSVHVSFQSVKV